MHIQSDTGRYCRTTGDPEACLSCSPYCEDAVSKLTSGHVGNVGKRRHGHVVKLLSLQNCNLRKSARAQIGKALKLRTADRDPIPGTKQPSNSGGPEAYRLPERITVIASYYNCKDTTHKNKQSKLALGRIHRRGR